jgi:hypothetical protein
MRIDAVASPRARYDGAIGGFPCPGFVLAGFGADGGVAGAAVDSSVSSAAARTIGEPRARRAREEDSPRATTTTARAASDDDDDDASDFFVTFDEDAAATRARWKLDDARADATATEDAAERTIGDIVSDVLLVSRRARATTRRARVEVFDAAANTAGKWIADLIS